MSLEGRILKLEDRLALQRRPVTMRVWRVESADEGWALDPISGERRRLAEVEADETADVTFIIRRVPGRPT